MLTQDDIELLKKNLATKDDLDDLVDRIKKGFDLVKEKFTRADNRFDRLEEKTGHVLRYAEIIEDERGENEKRLQKVESKLGIAV